MARPRNFGNPAASCSATLHDLVSASRKIDLSKSSLVAIIDDDEAVRAAAGSLVRSLGYILHIFASAEEFLRSNGVDDFQKSLIQALDRSRSFLGYLLSPSASLHLDELPTTRAL